MRTLKNWIVIAGNGRNTGKTTLACQIIYANRHEKVVGIKISPHHHPLDGTEEVLINQDNYCIIRERKPGTKDSSRMLQAGAEEVFYVQCQDAALPKALSELEKLSGNRPVVCESGGIRLLIKPAFFIMVISEQNSGKPATEEKLKLSDLVTDFDNIERYEQGQSFRLIKNEWKQSVMKV